MRLIDADILNVDDIPSSYGANCDVRDVQEWIDGQPTVEADQVRKGRWITRKTWDKFVCSYCSFEKILPTKYCPDCGAKMEG